MGRGEEEPGRGECEVWLGQVRCILRKCTDLSCSVFAERHDDMFSAVSVVKQETSAI